MPRPRRQAPGQRPRATQYPPPVQHRPSVQHPPAARHVAHRDRGSSVVELVIVLPALMLALVLFFQVAMWGIAAHALATAVADAGAAARAQYEGPSTAAAVARHDLGSLAGSLVSNPSVSVRVLAGGYVEVSVRASVPSLFPGLHPTVSAGSTGPIQEFRASG